MTRKASRPATKLNWPFVAFPSDLLKHPALYTLPSICFRLLCAFCSQYKGKNNGLLGVSFAAAKGFGISWYQGYLDAKLELEARGLIICTRRGAGGNRKLLNLYSLGWLSKDGDSEGRWRAWKPESMSRYGWTITRSHQKLERLKRLRGKPPKLTVIDTGGRQ